MLQALTDFFLNIHPLLVYGVIATALLLESSGVPLLNSSLLLLTAALASSGLLDIWSLFCAAFGGSIAGAYLAYLIGQHGGRRLLLRLTPLLRIDVKRVEMVERWFQRSGGWMVFFSRMTPYVRLYACFPAGIAQMSRPHFLLCAVSGSLIWCSTLLSVGWMLGSRWELAVLLMQQYTVPVFLILVLLLALYIIAKYSIKRRLRMQLSPSPSTEQSNIETHSESDRPKLDNPEPDARQGRVYM